MLFLGSEMAVKLLRLGNDVANYPIVELLACRMSRPGDPPPVVRLPLDPVQLLPRTCFLKIGIRGEAHIHAWTPCVL